MSQAKKNFISNGQKFSGPKDMLPLKSSDNCLVEGVPLVDLELDVPQDTPMQKKVFMTVMLHPPLRPTRKEPPNKPSKPITCLDRDHDPGVMKTIEVGQESLRVAIEAPESNIVKSSVELSRSNNQGCS